MDKKEFKSKVLKWYRDNKPDNKPSGKKISHWYELYLKGHDYKFLK